MAKLCHMVKRRIGRELCLMVGTIRTTIDLKIVIFHYVEALLAVLLGRKQCADRV